jgi:magnesium chelatase family protein
MLAKRIPIPAQHRNNLNLRVDVAQRRNFCVLNKEESELLRMAMTKLNFNARAYNKILRASRPIADLAGCENIKTEHLLRGTAV